jgi:transcription elongation factor Elf1
MLLKKKFRCQNCNREISKADLITIETAVGTRVDCCENCIDYFKVRRILK